MEYRDFEIRKLSTDEIYYVKTDFGAHDFSTVAECKAFIDRLLAHS